MREGFYSVKKTKLGGRGGFEKRPDFLQVLFRIPSLSIEFAHLVPDLSKNFRRPKDEVFVYEVICLGSVACLGKKPLFHYNYKSKYNSKVLRPLSTMLSTSP